MEKEIENMINLIKDNPDLPVIPLVGTGVVADDSYAYWFAAFGKAEIKEIVIGEETSFFKGEDDPETVLEEMLGWDSVENLSENDIQDVYNSLPWKKVIAVYIESPDLDLLDM